MCGPSSWLSSHFPLHRRGLSVFAGTAAGEDVNKTACLSDRVVCLAFTTATQPRMRALVQPVPLAGAGAPADRTASLPPCIPDTWPTAQSVSTAVRTVPTKRCLNGARWAPDAPRATVTRQCMYGTYALLENLTTRPSAWSIFNKQCPPPTGCLRFAGWSVSGGCSVPAEPAARLRT